MNQIFTRKKIKCLLYPYEIIATGKDCGLIEFVTDGLSIDYIRKAMQQQYNRRCDLYDYFRKNYGHVKSK
jgi:phosphatidylinositol kinase/protein kinase (PI-3  family)